MNSSQGKKQTPDFNNLPDIFASLFDSPLNQNRSTPAGSLSPDFEQKLSRGIDLMHAGSLEEAIAFFSEVVHSNPPNTSPWSNRARCYWKLGQLQQAGADLIEVLRREPGESVDMIALGELLGLQGRHEQAIKVLGRAATQLATGPANIPASMQGPIREQLHTNLAISLAETGQVDEALVNVRQAMQYSGRSPFLLEFRGNLLANLGDYDAALADLNAAIECDRSNYGPYLARARLWKTVHRTERMDSDIRMAIALVPGDAHQLLDVCQRLNDLASPHTIECINRLLVLQPENEDALLMRAWNLSGTDSDRAMVDLQQVIRLNPSNAWAWIARGKMLHESGKHDDALQSIRKGISLDQRNAEYHSVLGYALLDLKKYEESLTSFELALKLDPRCTAGYTGRGALFSDLGDFESAGKEASLALQVDPACADAFELQGTAQGELGKPELALDSFRKAIELGGDQARLGAMIAMTQMRLRKYSDAANELKKAFEFNPREAEVFYVGSLLEMAKGKRDSALKHIQKAIQLRPTDLRFQEQLAHVRQGPAAANGKPHGGAYHPSGTVRPITPSPRPAPEASSQTEIRKPESPVCKSDRDPSAGSVATACPGCGKPLAEPSPFCGNCGTAIQAQACRHCQAPVQPGSRFCGACGKPAR